jgi:hypothetical protein
MTVWVGDKPFSAVRHVSVEEGSTIQDPSGRRVDYKVSGQAVIIETQSGPVFALLTPESGQFGFGNYGAMVAGPALVPAIGKPAESEAQKAIREYREEQPGYDWLAEDAKQHNAMLQVEGPHPLPRSIPNPDRYRGERTIPVWPLFVRFGDINDPKNVRKVSPESIGVTGITIEITDDDVTEGIEDRLGWLVSMRGELLNKDTVMRPQAALPGQIGTGDFVLGMVQ